MSFFEEGTQKSRVSDTRNGLLKMPTTLKSSASFANIVIFAKMLLKKLPPFLAICSLFLDVTRIKEMPCVFFNGIFK